MDLLKLVLFYVRIVNSIAFHYTILRKSTTFVSKPDTILGIGVMENTRSVVVGLYDIYSQMTFIPVTFFPMTYIPNVNYTQ